MSFCILTHYTVVLYSLHTYNAVLGCRMYDAVICDNLSSFINSVYQILSKLHSCLTGVVITDILEKLKFSSLLVVDTDLYFD